MDESVRRNNGARVGCKTDMITSFLDIVVEKPNAKGAVKQKYPCGRVGGAENGGVSFFSNQEKGGK